MQEHAYWATCSATRQRGKRRDRARARVPAPLANASLPNSPRSSVSRDTGNETDTPHHKPKSRPKDRHIRRSSSVPKKRVHWSDLQPSPASISGTRALSTSDRALPADRVTSSTSTGPSAEPIRAKRPAEEEGADAYTSSARRSMSRSPHIAKGRPGCKVLNALNLSRIASYGNLKARHFRAIRDIKCSAKDTTIKERPTAVVVFNFQRRNEGSWVGKHAFKKIGVFPPKAANMAPNTEDVTSSTASERTASSSSAVKDVASPSTENKGITAPGAIVDLAVAPSADDERVVTPSANDNRAAAPVTEGENTAAPSAVDEHVIAPSTEGKNAVAPSEGVANMGQFGVDICNTACGKYSGSLDNVGSSTSHALALPVTQSAFEMSAAASSQNDTAGFVVGSSERTTSQRTGATGIPISKLLCDQPSAQPTLGMDTGASTLSLSSNTFGVNGSQQQFGGYSPQYVDSSGSWPQPASTSTSTSDWPVHPLGAFVGTTGGQVNVATEGDIEIDAEGDIEVDAEDAMEERADIFMDEDAADAVMEDCAEAAMDGELIVVMDGDDDNAIMDERTDTAMDDVAEAVAAERAGIAMRETLADRFAPFGTSSNFCTGAAHFGAASKQRLGTTQFGAAGSFNSGMASGFALLSAPSSSNSGAGNGFGPSTVYFGGANGFGFGAAWLGATGSINASTVQSGAATSFGEVAGQSGDADGFGAGAAHLGTASEQCSDAAPLGTTNEESLGAALFIAASNAGSGAVNSALRGEPNNAEDPGWDTDGFMAGDTCSCPANGSSSAMRYSSDGKFSAGSGSNATTGAESDDVLVPVSGTNMNTALVSESGAYPSDALVPATSANAAPVPAHGTDAGAAIFLAPDASANATLAPVPSVGPSNSLAPATSISINGVVDSITLLGLSGGTAASTALAGASAADSAPAIGTSTTVYVGESDGIHEYEETLEASETGLVNRTALLARPQPAEDPEIGEASEMASGPSLVTDAGAAIVSAHGTDAGATLALAPTFGPSGGPIPPIATSVNDINNMVSLLRLDGGAVGELSINQIYELASGLSLRTAARKEPDSARHSRWSPGSGSTTRSESTEESLSHAVDARQINALRMFLAAPTLSNLGPSRLRHPRPSVPIEMHIQLPPPRPLRRQPWTQTLAPGRGPSVARSAEDSPGRSVTASYPSSLATPDAAARSRAV